jgi:hypothetical protein
LESRDVPALFGQPWADPSTLSVSLLPDGTAVPGGASRLFAALAGIDVQAVVAEAVQAWVEQTPINFHFVTDGGLALGSPGAAQGDSRFGDIRVAGVDLSPDVLAITAPQEDVLSGTVSGDILINTRATFDRASLLHVLLHEAAHSLGLGHSDDLGSVRFPPLDGAAALTADDVADVQAIYGPRPADQNEGATGNDSLETATRLGRGDGDVPLKAGELTTRADADVYTFRAGGTVATVHLRASGLSLVRARVTVLDTTGVVLATQEAADRGGDVTLTLSGLKANRRYYVRVTGAANDVFAVGRYAVVVTEPGDPPLSPAEVLRAALASFDSQQTIIRERDTDLGQIVRVISAPGGLAQLRGSIAGGEEDLYRLTAPKDLTDGSWTVSLTLPEGGTPPAVTLLDQRGRALSGKVLVNTAGQLTLRVDGVTAGQRYFIKVSGAAGTGATPYVLVSQFSAAPAAPSTFLSGNLTPSAGDRGSLLAVYRSVVFQFTLAAESGAVRMVLRDSTGATVCVLDVVAGQTSSSALVLLRPGLYTVEMASAGGDQARGLRLSGVAFTDPIGPGFTDPTLTPQMTTGDPFAFLLPLEIVITCPDVWYIPGVGGAPPIYVDPVTGLPLEWGQVPTDYLGTWWVPPMSGEDTSLQSPVVK